VDSHAVIRQVPWVPDSRHTSALQVGLESKVEDHTELELFSRQQTKALLELYPLCSGTARMQVSDVGQRDLMHQRLSSALTMVLNEQPPLVSQLQLLSFSSMPAITARTNPLWPTVHGGCNYINDG